MKVSKIKGQKPRYPVLKSALLYDGTMGPLLSHLRANNTQEIHVLRSLSNFVSTSVYQRLRANLLAKPPAKANLEEVLRYNDSVAYLRTRHTKLSKKISKSNFGYPIAD